MRIAAGIDLGTSTSEIVLYINEETKPINDPKTVSPIITSAVAYDKKNGRLLVGNNALKYVGVEGCFVQEAKRAMGTEAKIDLGGSEYKPEEISAMILKHLKQLAEATYGIEIQEAVVTVPANFPNAARKATLAAAEIAGLKVLKLINEPTAAAIAFGIRNMELEETLLVFDWGGGTLDVTVLEMIQGILDVKASYGDPYLGGKDFDQILTEHVVSRFRKEYPNAQIVVGEPDLKLAVKRLKESLSTEEVSDIFVPGFAKEGNELIDLDILVSRTEFDQVIAPLISRARSVVQEALSKKNTSKESVTKVLCVGGTTYIPAVRNMLKEIFPDRVSVEIDPDLAVSTGAAVEAATLSGLISREKGLITTNVSPYGIGVEIVSIVGKQAMLVYDPLIEPNTSLPFSISKDYSLLREDQNSMEIRVLQSHHSGVQRVEDTVYTGITASIDDIPISSTGVPHPVEILFSYDNNGLINLEAFLPSTGQNVHIDLKESDMTMSDSEKEKSVRKINTLWNESRLYMKYRTILERTESLISTETLDKEQLQRLVSLLTELKDAISRNEEGESERLSEKLSVEIFDIENL